MRNAIKNWSPRHWAHADLTPEDHMRRMYSVGNPDSKLMYFNPVVTGLSAGLLWGFVIWAMVQQETATEQTGDAQNWVADVWNWLYMVSQNIWIVILIYILFKYYHLKLGKPDDEPEFGDGTYFAMLFSCGVATGLWYFSAEAMWHYESSSSRLADTQMFNDNTKAEYAIMVTFFHWGIHGWIPYTVVGALIALQSYRRGFPMSMRFTMYPVIGEMCYGVVGDLIEVLSILCTVFGVCTSLGLGAKQLNKGLVRLDRGTYRGQDRNGDCIGVACFQRDGLIGIEENTLTQIVLIIVITLLATASVIAGLKAGIAALSQLAFVLSAFVLISVMFMDNTWYILNALTSSFGYYLWYMPKISFHTDAWEELGNSTDRLGGAPDDRGGAKGWMGGWTIFYWGWWISWGPFVGTFLARISKGRKLGHFIIASLILPSIWSFLVLGVFGASQIRITNLAKAAGLVGCKAKDAPCPGLIYGNLADKNEIGYTRWDKQHIPVDDGTTRLGLLSMEDTLFEHFSFYGGFGFSTFMTVVMLFCILIYFVTSSDSASFVVDIMAANGVEEPPLLQKVFWAFTEGAAAAALLASGSDDSPDAALNAVKSLPIILGLPFTFLLFWMCQGLLIVCREEAGECPIERRHFSTFLFNLEKQTWVAVVLPFLPLGVVGAKAWETSVWKSVFGFWLLWASTIVLTCLASADKQFAYLGGAMYIIMATAAAGVRASTRARLKISGDVCSDLCACVFAFPCAIGQMAAEDLDFIPPKIATDVSDVSHNKSRSVSDGQPEKQPPLIMGAEKQPGAWTANTFGSQLQPDVVGKEDNDLEETQAITTDHIDAKIVGHKVADDAAKVEDVYRIWPEGPPSDIGVKDRFETVQTHLSDSPHDLDKRTETPAPYFFCMPNLASVCGRSQTKIF